MNNKLNDFLSFKRMITPIIIQIIFWVGVIFSILFGVNKLIQERGDTLQGLILIVLGPFLVRIICEMLILSFRINETLTDINNNIKKES